ncbi:MAG: flagellar hook-associated protein FlgK [Desulfobacterota bacterium]|nr:flagellar hook-associated protein FlgK [Thermodesulfobacteriota bacterium]
MSNIGIFGTLQIAKEGLFVQQSSVSVTSHNLANASTPGYSRQQPVISTIDPQLIGGIYFGRGARLTAITKSYDKFLNNSIMLEKNVLGGWQAQQTHMSRLETVFNETGDNGINALLTEFWNAWHDLADNPTGIAERAVVQRAGQSLANTIQRKYADLEQVQTDANNSIVTSIATVNRLAREIAQLNGQILGTETQGGNANDLTDTRSLKLEELSELIDIRVLEAPDGQITVLTSFGKPLVAENLYWSLAAKVDEQRNNLYAIHFVDKDTSLDITDKISGGKLKGLLEVRDKLVPSYMDQLNQLAASLVTEVNRRHYQGYGLDGSTGNYFFNPVPITISSVTSTAGMRISNAQITDPTKLCATTVTLRFTHAPPDDPRYELYDTLNEQYLFRIDAENATLVFNDSGSDTIIALSHGDYTGANLAKELEQKLNAKAAAGQQYAVSYNRATRKFTIANKGAASVDFKWDALDSTIAGLLGFSGTETVGAGSATKSSLVAGTYAYAAQHIQILANQNDQVVFRDDGTLTERIAQLKPGTYTPNELAAELKRQLEAASGAGQTYTVTFDAAAQTFRIRNDAGNTNSLDLLWSSSNAASMLGFESSDTTNILPGNADQSDIGRYCERTFIVLDSTNSIVFDDGGTGGTVTARLTSGTYTGAQLAAEIERALESTSGSSGQDYIVTFNAREGSFTIINATGNLHSINFDWTSSSAAALLGFSAAPTPPVPAGSLIRSDNPPVGSVVAYNTISFSGLSMRMSDDTALPRVGTAFTISTVMDAAKTIALDSVTASNPRKIAAALDVFDIDGSNNTIVFDDDGTLDNKTYRVVIPSGRYTAQQLAAEIERQLEQNGSGQSYAVSYDTATRKFSIASNPSNTNDLYLLWDHAATNAAFTLGYHSSIYEIKTGVNDDIDFREDGIAFTATLTPGRYTGDELAKEIETRLTAQGTGEYSVSYDAATRTFTITNKGTNTTTLDLMWATSGAAATLGFDSINTIGIAPGTSDASDFSFGALAVGTRVSSDFTTGGVSVGDNRNALGLAALCNERVLAQGTMTIGEFYSVLTGRVGSDGAQVNNGVTQEEFMIQQYEQRRQSIAGVSVDEEMINLIKYQQAFAASAKLISALNEMLDKLLSIRT